MEKKYVVVEESAATIVVKLSVYQNIPKASRVVLEILAQDCVFANMIVNLMFS